MTRDEVRAWAATLDDDARARWLKLLDALDWERARADKAEADGAALRRQSDAVLNTLELPQSFRDDIPASVRLVVMQRRSLLDEVAALRARVAELEARRLVRCKRCWGSGRSGANPFVDCPTCGGAGAVMVEADACPCGASLPHHLAAEAGQWGSHRCRCARVYDIAGGVLVLREVTP